MTTRSAIVLVLILVVGAGLVQAGEKKLELGFTLGGGSGAAESASRYSRTWSAEFLQRAEESAEIIMAKQGGFFSAVDLTYYFTPALGVQLSAAVSTSNPVVTSEWAVDFNYEGWPTVSRHGTFLPGSARLTRVPVSLDLVGRVRLGPVKIFGQAGPALFFNRFSADADSIYGQTYFEGFYPLYGDQWTDFFEIPVRVSETKWVAVGADFGAGIETRVAGPVSLTVGGRYFLCPAKDFAWQWVQATYSSFVFKYDLLSLVALTDFAAEQALTTALRIKPSFFSVAGGIRIVF